MDILSLIRCNKLYDAVSLASGIFVVRSLIPVVNHRAYCVCHFVACHSCGSRNPINHVFARLRSFPAFVAIATSAE